MDTTIFTKIFRIIFVLLFFSSTLIGFPINYGGATADPTLEQPDWPTWVHRHWVWENSGTQDSAMELATGYLDRDIPVGAVIIDRPWATDSNTFIPDPALYPDLADYVDAFHDKDIRVFMWATSMINETASNYQEAYDKGYFVGNGAKVKWWGGTGSLIDYTNPDAVTWWHTQMDPILDMGIDGWKVDGTDLHVMLAFPWTGKNDVNITWEEYRNACYGDFFNYTREKLGNDRVISARPVDDQLLSAGLPLKYTNTDINFAGWVGDNDNTWAGLQHALGNMFTSAQYGFVSYGSDIGGFRSEGDLQKDVFTRWTQLGAFCPIMENGGGGEHRPWMVDEETTDIYRRYVNLHEALIPYIYSSAAYSYELGLPTMRPQNGDYIYMLGDNLLIAPYFEAGDTREVVFPEGEWLYMFDESEVHQKGTETLTFALDEFPVYIRKGSITPMEITTDDTGFGSALSSYYTTVLVYPQNGSEKFGLYEEDKTGAMISYTKDDASLTLTTTETDRMLLYRVYGQTAPASVTSGGENLYKASSVVGAMFFGGYCTDDSGVTWIAINNANAGSQITVNY